MGFLDDIIVQSQNTWPVARVAGLVVMRDRVAAQWPASRTTYPIEAAVAITRGVTDALSSLQAEVVRFAADGYLIAAELQGLIGFTLQEYSGAIGTCISSAKRAGLQTVNCPNLRSATIRAINSIINYYDKLGESAARGGADLGILSFVEKLMTTIGEFLVKGYEATKDALAAVGRGVSVVGDLIKWGSIGGGLFMLYWYVLRPKR